MNGRLRLALLATMCAGAFLLGGCAAEGGGTTPTAAAPASSTPTPDPEPTAEPDPPASSAVLPTDCGTLASDATRAETVGDMTLQSDGADFVRPAPDGAALALGCDWIVGEASGVLLLISTADDAAVTAGLDALTADGWECQPAEDFEFVTQVNYKGYFLCVQKASPVMAVQHLARADYWSDIIQINSKSGLVGSNRNFAYAGSKFGGIGLTQSFALELMADGIKVNSICPGNYFDGPLWSDPETGLFVQYLRTGKVPGAKTIEDVRKAYEAKVPMGRGCATADVMKTVYYLMEQQYETGQAVPVTGGQVMLK